MKLNVLAYNFRKFDGYGRYVNYMIRALQRAGVRVTPHFAGAADAPAWMLSEWGIDWRVPTLSCLPPYYLRKLPHGAAPHWLLSMTEGSELPNGWASIINKANVERVIVPCEHNAEAFRQGTHAPVSVIPGGTDPDDFPLRDMALTFDRPYTFLTLADRGNRKGWFEAYHAFYRAFGDAKDGDQNVRLLVKYRPKGSDIIDMILAKTRPEDRDPRIVYFENDAESMTEVYAQADCLVLPSRCEGWGMPHREAAMTGLPVITQAYSGMDDGHTHEWAIVVEQGHMQPIGAAQDSHIKGDWRVVDIDELAAKMRHCYEQPYAAHQFGRQAAKWLFLNQTWMHSAQTLIELLQREHVLEPERIHA